MNRNNGRPLALRTKSKMLEPLESRTLLAVSGLPITLGSPGFDSGKRIAATPDGGFIEAGIFSGTVDFDPGAGVSQLTAQADTDIFIAKYDSSGAFQWVEQIGGTDFRKKITNQDKIIDIAADPRRAGLPFINGVGADPKLAAEMVNDLVVQSDGTILLAGDFAGQVDFDPGPGKKIFTTADKNYYDGFVMKLNSSGGLVWADQFGSTFSDSANAIATDSGGNIFVTGLFTRTVDFVPGNRTFQRTALGRADGYLLKLNTAGKVQFVNTFGGEGTSKSYRDAGLDVAVDSHNNVVVVGSFAGKADFDPSAAAHFLTGSRNTDGFVAKYTDKGAYVSAVAFTGRGYEAINNVAIDSANNIVVTGYFEGTDFDADPGPGTTLVSATPVNTGDNPKFLDMFVEKLNSNFQMQWVQQLAGPGFEFIDQMKIDSSDNIILGGSFYSSRDFNTRFGTGGPLLASGLNQNKFDHDANDSSRFYSYDAFLWKLSSSGTTAWVNQIGGVNDDFGGGVDIESDGSILFTGRFSGFVNFATSGGLKRIRGLGFGDVFVAQFDANGAAV